MNIMPIEKREQLINVLIYFDSYSLDIGIIIKMLGFVLYLYRNHPFKYLFMDLYRNLLRTLLVSEFVLSFYLYKFSE